MASLLNQRWLHSTVEHELKELVEWRQLRDIAARNVSDLYRDDGGSLYARWTAGRNDPCAVQILETFPRAPNKFRLSDGHASVIASLTTSAKQKLQEEDDKSLSDLQNGQIICVPEFEIKATGVGKGDHKVQLMIQQMRVISTMRSGTIGHPQEIHTMPRVHAMLANLRELSGASAADKMEEQNDHISNGRSQHATTQGSLYQNCESQTFATQMWSRARMNTHSEQSSAVNLAAPVNPMRSEAKRSTTSSRTMSGGSDFKNPLDLLSLLPAAPHIATSKPTKTDGDRSTSAPVKAARHTSATNSSSGYDKQRHIGTVDLTSDGEEQAEIAEDADIDVEMADVNESEKAEPDHNRQEDDGVAKQRRASFREEAVHSQIITSKSPQTIRHLKAGSDPPRSPDRMSEFHASRLSPRTKAPLSWHGLTQIRRSFCVIPPDQQNLLNRKESWNPPNPGQHFPCPSLPRALVEQLEKRKRMSAFTEDVAAESDGSDGLPRHEQSPTESDSSHSPSATPEEECFAWPPTSPTSGHRDDLPPDSSVPKPLERDSNSTRIDKVLTKSDTMTAADNSPPSSTDDDDLMESVERTLSSGTSFNSKPLANVALRNSPQSLSIPPSTTNLTRSQPHRRDMKPDTLLLSESSALDEAPSKPPPSGRRAQPSSNSVSKQDRIIASTYTPHFQSAQAISTPRLSKLADRNLTMMSNLPSIDVDKMAEEQLQEELRASAQKPSRVGNYPNEHNSLSSPLVRTSGDADEMAFKSSTPPQILGKRIPDSPASPEDRRHKSRFGFSQEEPVSQDPSYIMAQNRKQFLAKQKQSKSFQQSDSQEYQSSPPTTPKRLGAILVQPDISISSSPPKPSEQPETTSPVSPMLQDSPNMSANVKTNDASNSSIPLVPTNLASAKQSEQRSEALDHGTLLKAFSATYPAYTGDLRHFTNLIGEIKRARNPVHHFLWDDYVIRNKTDYLPYSIECLNAGERPMPYDTFYTTRIPKPLYLEGILLPVKLDALNSLEDSRHSRKEEASLRRYEHTSSIRSTYASPREVDRYVPPSRSPRSAMPPPSTSRADRPRKQNRLFMMSFGGDDPAQTRRARSSNAFTQSRGPPPAERDDIAMPSSAAPKSTAASGRRSLPWSTPDSSRASNNPDHRARAVSDSRRGPTKGGRRF